MVSPHTPLGLARVERLIPKDRNSAWAPSVSNFEKMLRIFNPKLLKFCILQVGCIAEKRRLIKMTRWYQIWFSDVNWQSFYAQFTVKFNTTRNSMISINSTCVSSYLNNDLSILDYIICYRNMNTNKSYIVGKWLEHLHREKWNISSANTYNLYKWLKCVLYWSNTNHTYNQRHISRRSARVRDDLFVVGICLIYSARTQAGK